MYITKATYLDQRTVARISYSDKLATTSKELSNSDEIGE